ncbi:MAG TPA: HIT family protein [Streptosporangiaceae bacterium]|nr:HIT family protein [Streptosporangiaceae bacterium]
MTTPADCYTCVQDAGLRAGASPLRERIAADELWRVAHAFGSAIPGWLVLVPRRHVTSLAELTDAEGAAMGSWQVRLSRALQAVLGCQKTYVALFAEAEGFSHVHFHIVPRHADLAKELRGPRIFQLLSPADRPAVSEQQVDEVSAALADELARSAPESLSS